jgi:uncharacterized glyoxalase superfamily protein PhnB
MISDAIMNSPTVSSTFLYVEDVDAWWKRATAAGAQVTMPIADMFWGDRYGVVADKWGNRWGIATRQEDLSFEEQQKRGAEAMKSMK